MHLNIKFYLQTLHLHEIDLPQRKKNQERVKCCEIKLINEEERFSLLRTFRSFNLEPLINQRPTVCGESERECGEIIRDYSLSRECSCTLSLTLFFGSDLGERIVRDGWWEHCYKMVSAVRKGFEWLKRQRTWTVYSKIKKSKKIN